MILRTNLDDEAMNAVGGDVVKYVEEHTPGGIKGAKQALDNYGKTVEGEKMEYHTMGGIAVAAALVVWLGIMVYIFCTIK